MTDQWLCLSVFLSVCVCEFYCWSDIDANLCISDFSIKFSQLAKQTILIKLCMCVLVEITILWWFYLVMVMMMVMVMVMVAHWTHYTNDTKLFSWLMAHIPYIDLNRCRTQTNVAAAADVAFIHIASSYS